MTFEIYYGTLPFFEESSFYQGDGFHCPTDPPPRLPPMQQTLPPFQKTLNITPADTTQSSKISVLSSQILPPQHAQKTQNPASPLVEPEFLDPFDRFETPDPLPSQESTNPWIHDLLSTQTLPLPADPRSAPDTQISEASPPILISGKKFAAQLLEDFNTYIYTPNIKRREIFNTSITTIQFYKKITKKYFEYLKEGLEASAALSKVLESVNATHSKKIKDLKQFTSFIEILQNDPEAKQLLYTNKRKKSNDFAPADAQDFSQNVFDDFQYHFASKSCLDNMKFKSSRNFYDQYQYAIRIYRDLLEINYPEDSAIKEALDRSRKRKKLRHPRHDVAFKELLQKLKENPEVFAFVCRK